MKKVSVKYDTDKINGVISVCDIITHYHQVGRNKGRTNCPFCTGMSSNTLGYNAHIWHCFRCGAKGDGIEFVMKMFNVDFKAAFVKLCDDFHIPMDSKPTLAQQYEYTKKIAERKLKQITEAEIKERNNFNFKLACRYMWWLRSQPKTKTVLFQLEEMEYWTERMAVGEMEIDYDIKAALKCLRLLITEERNGTTAGIAGNESQANSGMDSGRF